MLRSQGSASPNFKGGRHLLAISLNTKLTSTEKHVLHEIAAMMDFTVGISDRRWIPVQELALRTSLSPRTIFRTLNSLQDAGYIVRSKRTTPDRMEPLPSRFGLTERIFQEQHEQQQEANKVRQLFVD